jgi:hypothetical protein
VTPDGPSVGFPLRGEWTALHTPAERVPSHGTDYFGQRYAFDFARLIGPFSKAYRKPIWQHIAIGIPVDDCYGWGQPVHAPFDGQVVTTGEGWPDGRRLHLVWDLLKTSFFPPDATPDDYRPLTGNYVLLEGEPGVALLAHLRCDSLQVRPGDAVKEGAVLGAVGHSGNSTTPHLHFHVMDGRNPFTAQGVPCRFRRYERFRSGVWEPVVDGVPDALEPVRFFSF